jgi:hypothetical protein
MCKWDLAALDAECIGFENVQVQCVNLCWCYLRLGNRFRNIMLQTKLSAPLGLIVYSGSSC